MPSVEVFDLSKATVGSIELDSSIFGVEVRVHLFHAAVRYQLAKRRSGTHATKGRALVSGGGKKPFRQKGTGRARQGSTRAPHWRGGGVVHGPHFRSHAHKLSKRTRRAALCSAISRRTEEGALTVFNSLALPEIKTRQVSDLLKRFEMGSVLVVATDADTNFKLSSRNLQGVTVVPAEGLNVYDVLKHDHLALTVESVNQVVARLKG